MQRRQEVKRPRISVSLDLEDYEWIDSLPGPSTSLSYKVSRLIKAARIAGLTIEDAKAQGPLSEFNDWLKTRCENKLARDLSALLSEFLRQPRG